MPLTADRCRETSTTTGTGSITLLGAVSQFQSFNTAFADGAVVEFEIAGQTGAEWETVRGTFTSPSTLSRDLVISSSNSNALVSFSAGTKDVFATVSAATLLGTSLGQTLAQSRGMALP